MAYLHLTAEERVRRHRNLTPSASIKTTHDAFMQQGLSERDRDEIESLTRNPIDNPIFPELKSGIITSNLFKRAVRQVRPWNRDPDDVDRDVESLLSLVVDGPRRRTAQQKWTEENMATALDCYWAANLEELKIHYVNYNDLERMERNPGLFVSRQNPLLGAVPDAVVYDETTGWHDRVVIVKCPYKKRHLDPKDAAPSACVERSNGKWYLRNSHEWAYELNGTTGITGYHLCDFIVYTTRGINIMTHCCNDEPDQLCHETGQEVPGYDVMMRNLSSFSERHLYPWLASE